MLIRYKYRKRLHHKVVMTGFILTSLLVIFDFPSNIVHMANLTVNMLWLWWEPVEDEIESKL